MTFPVHNRLNVPSWYGLFTTGPKTGKWQRFHKYTTMAPVIINGLYLAMEWTKGTAYTVFYQRILIDPERPDYYLLREVERATWAPEKNFQY